MMGCALDFEPLACALKHPVWALDLFGHAETPPHPLDYEIGEVPPLLSFEEMTQHTAGLLEELLRRFDEPCELLGYSMGGRLALSVVALWTREGNTQALNRVKHLTLLGASPGLEGEAERQARREADERWAERLEGYEGESLEEVLDVWSAQPILARLAEVCPERAAEQRERRLELHIGEALACAMRALSLGGMPPLWAELSALPCPTRWVSGALDVKFSALAQRAAEAQGERASVHLLDGAGHSAHLEAPEALAPLLS
jgi:2-succinyl-6-hydroxy-2,4-cyclohexadiene-1-carboxylate synthase